MVPLKVYLRILAGQIGAFSDHRRNGEEGASWISWLMEVYMSVGRMLIETERLLLRRWKEEDREPFYRDELGSARDGIYARVHDARGERFAL